MAWWQKTGTTRPRSSVLALGVLAAGAAVATALWWRGTAVEVATVTAGPIQHSLVFSARVASVARTDISSTLTARVERIQVREGDAVKAGQLLIALDDSDLRAQAQQAQAALATAEARLKSQFDLAAPVATQAVAQGKANLDFAQSELERNRALHGKGFIGDARLQDAERALVSARAAYQQAVAQAGANTRGGAEAAASEARVREAQGALQIVRAKLEQSRIVAPADGRIIFRSVEAGDVAQPGKKLLTLATSGETRLIGQIDEKNLSLLREGMRAVASADAFPTQKFDAELIYLAPSVDVTRGTVEARLRVDKPPAFLRDDMTVSAEVVVARKANTLSIPAGAIREASGQQVVLTIADGNHGAAEERAVKVGVRSLQRAEILDGLKAGDLVLLDDRIRAGQRVRGVAPVAPTRPRNVELPM